MVRRSTAASVRIGAREADLETRLSYTFSNPSLLVCSLRHRSFVAEQPGESNERLEFLGDAVLQMIVTEYAYAQYPDLPEGELAKVRASVVSASTLAELADELNLGEAIYLGKGESASGGREKPSILADAFEAVLGAVYLDGGWVPAVRIVLDLLRDRIAESAAGPGGADFKTRLQELAARTRDGLPTYEITSTGPDHARRFRAVVHINGRVGGRGEGRSKKHAEQSAAREAWERLERLERLRV